MEFTCNTKPLSDGLSLGVINQNVSKFYKKSCLAQVSVADSSTLKVNLEAASLKTEISVKGHAEGSPSTPIFVDSLLFKQLMSTLDSNTVTLSLEESGLKIVSGKSKFTLPKMVETSDLELSAPDMPESIVSSFDKVDKEGWKFIKEHQMYAIAMSFVTPVYTKVWVGESGDVLVGDFDNSLFTHSKKGNLRSTCLVSDTIVNLFNSVPDDAKIKKASDTEYIIYFETDAMTYVSEFTTQLESDESVGSYNSEIILSMMTKDADNCIKVDPSKISKLLNQAVLLSEADDGITVTIDNNIFTLKNDKVDGKVEGSASKEIKFSLDFNIESLKSVVSNYGDSEVFVTPIYQDDESAGLLFWNKDLCTLISGSEE